MGSRRERRENEPYCALTTPRHPAQQACASEADGTWEANACAEPEGGGMEGSGGMVTLASSSNLFSAHFMSLSPTPEPSDIQRPFLLPCFHLCHSSAQKTLGRFYHLARGWRPGREPALNGLVRLHQHRPAKLHNGVTQALPDQEP